MNDDVEEEEIEEDMPWIQEKALDIVEFSGSVTQALPGPRVGKSSIPWILAVPLAYVGISFVLAVVKTVRKFTSPKQARRNLVSLDKYVLIACYLISVISVRINFMNNCNRLNLAE